MVTSLHEANRYFIRAEHAHLELPEEIGNNADAMRPDFDWDAVDLKIIDVSTYERITITAAQRKSNPASSGSVQQALIPLTGSSWALAAYRGASRPLV